MAELVEKYDGEDGQILEDVPEDGTVGAVAALDFESRHEEPGPVEEDGDSGDAEDAKRTLAAEHGGSLMEWSAAVAGKALASSTCRTFTSKDANLVFYAGRPTQSQDEN
jgi:hypothetical protein